MKCPPPQKDVALPSNASRSDTDNIGQLNTSRREFLRPNKRSSTYTTAPSEAVSVSPQVRYCQNADQLGSLFRLVQKRRALCKTSSITHRKLPRRRHPHRTQAKRRRTPLRLTTSLPPLAATMSIRPALNMLPRHATTIPLSITTIMPHPKVSLLLCLTAALLLRPKAT
jgi:hypothetical protein